MAKSRPKAAAAAKVFELRTRSSEYLTGSEKESGAEDEDQN